MTAHIEIEAGAVAQEDVTAPPPGHHAPEQVARHLVGRQPLLPSEGAGDAVLSLDPEYPPVHISKLRASTASVMGGASAATPEPLAMAAFLSRAQRGPSLDDVNDTVLLERR